MMYRFGRLRRGAQATFSNRFRSRPGFAPAFLNLGNVYFMQGDYDKALAGYQSAVELDSTSAVANYNIGQTYIKKMLFAQSGEWLERANILGIDAYRSAHPAIGLEKPARLRRGIRIGRALVDRDRGGRGAARHPHERNAPAVSALSVPVALGALRREPRRGDDHRVEAPRGVARRALRQLRQRDVRRVRERADRDPALQRLRRRHQGSEQRQGHGGAPENEAPEDRLAPGSGRAARRTLFFPGVVAHVSTAGYSPASRSRSSARARSRSSSGEAPTSRIRAR